MKLSFPIPFPLNFLFGLLKLAALNKLIKCPKQQAKEYGRCSAKKNQWNEAFFVIFLFMKYFEKRD